MDFVSAVDFDVLVSIRIIYWDIRLIELSVGFIGVHNGN